MSIALDALMAEVATALGKRALVVGAPVKRRVLKYRDNHKLFGMVQEDSIH
jgi:hypothetical protein